MNFIAQLFSSRDVLLDLDVTDKQALFEAVGCVVQEGHRGMAAAEVADSLRTREQLGSTGLGHGVAIPHARINGLDNAMAVFVRLKSPIQFDSPDGRPVAYCFVLLVPSLATELHLKILADAAEMFSNVQFRERLGTIKNQDEVHQLFAGWQAPIFGRDK